MKIVVNFLLILGLTLWNLKPVAALTSPEITGVSMVQITPAIQDELLHAGPIVLWAAEDWALILKDSLPTERPLFESCEGDYLYLLAATEDGWAGVLSQIGRCIEFAHRQFLLESSHDISDEVAILPLTFVRLLGMDRYIVPRPAAPLPSVTRNESIQQLVDRLDGNQLFSDLVALADFGTRQSYSPGCAAAGEWLLNTFAGLGYAVNAQTHRSEMAPNIMAELPGAVHPDQIVIVCGHYDSISLYPLESAPGADDNGTGTAATLNAARVMAGVNFEKTVRFIAFSGEEQGLVGSNFYSRQAYNEGEDIVGVYNLDMIGWVEPYPEDLDCIGNPGSSALVDWFIDCIQAYTDLPARKVINSNLTYSDHSPFWRQGYQALLGIEDYQVVYPYYHSVDDTPDKIDRAFFTEVTRGVIGAVAETAGYVGTTPPTPQPEAITVYPVLSDTDFIAGERFQLGVSYKNPSGIDRTLPLFVVLEAAGNYWFWPSWTGSMNYQFRFLTADDRERYEQILLFDWPTGAGAMENLRFWSAFMSEDLSGIVGQYDSITWSYH